LLNRTNTRLLVATATAIGGPAAGMVAVTVGAIAATGVPSTGSSPNTV
jgi:hypothetical protein